MWDKIMPTNHAAPKRQTDAYWQAAAERMEQVNSTRGVTQLNHFTSPIEAMNNSLTPQSITEQQTEETVNNKKKGNFALERIREQATRWQKKDEKTKHKKTTSNEVDSDEDEIQSAQTLDTSIIKQENKKGEEMREREEVLITEAMQNQVNWQDRRKSQCDVIHYKKLKRTKRTKAHKAKRRKRQNTDFFNIYQSDKHPPDKLIIESGRSKVQYCWT